MESVGSHPATLGTPVVEKETLETREGEAPWEALFESPGATASDEATSLDALLETVPQRQEKVDGLLIGKLTGANESGEPQVDFPGSPCSRPQSARSMAAWTPSDLGREVVLMFEGGNAHRPVMLGFLQRPHVQPRVQAEKDGERLVLTAEKEIVLRCGEASITLTRAGKVLIRGTYLLSRSSGVNRIKGGSVQIN